MGLIYTSELLRAANYANNATGSLIRAADNCRDYVPQDALEGLLAAARLCLELALQDPDTIQLGGIEALTALNAIVLA